ncbi:J domain-containing protein [Heracleum sosnowskyi]|uniref:J domain-containing protein n=1 Tax=Heracleum sosnowskyi TaxID=360622 RepID=A0AAD8M3N9_9APIA|nr:J domain-containing protein [Heracleum sosnowskyi]
MAAVGGLIGGTVSCSSSTTCFQKDLTRKKRNNNKFRVNCLYSPVSSDPYKTLKIHPGASESEVKKAFRRLALQYHPDVCRGTNCGVQFHQINEAYEALMNRLREEEEAAENNERRMYGGDDEDDQMRGMYDPDWDMWEEWMGWEGAGIRDYSSHINPYI